MAQMGSTDVVVKYRWTLVNRIHCCSADQLLSLVLCSLANICTGRGFGKANMRECNTELPLKMRAPHPYWATNLAKLVWWARSERFENGSSTVRAMCTDALYSYALTLKTIPKPVSLTNSMANWSPALDALVRPVPLTVVGSSAAHLYALLALWAWAYDGIVFDFDFTPLADVLLAKRVTVLFICGGLLSEVLLYCRFPYRQNRELYCAMLFFIAVVS